MTREEGANKIVPRKITLEVEVGDGATMCITDPLAYEDGGPEWISRYGNIELHRYQIASMIESYDYLLSDLINMTEAVRRLRIMRAARRDGFKRELVRALALKDPADV